MGKSKNKQEIKPKRPMGYAEACRDVIITSINRGQLPILGFIAIILLILFRIPESEIVTLIHEMISSLGRFAILSYIFNLGLVFAWVWHAKSVRQMHSQECDRVGREKTQLQQEQLKNNKYQEESSNG